MARPQEIQQHEIQAFVKFAAVNGLRIDDEAGLQNGEVLARPIVGRDQEITEQTLQTEFDRVQDQLIFKSQAERSFENAVPNQEDRDLILNFVRKRDLHDTGDNLFINAATIANRYFGNERLGLDAALQYCTVSGRSPLYWKTRKQGAELEREKQRSASSSAPRQERADFLDPNKPRLAPHLQHHRDMLHRQSDTPKPAQDTEAEWKNRAESVHLSTNSNLDQTSCKRLFVTRPEDSSIDWAATTRAREQFIARRAYERQQAGR